MTSDAARETEKESDNSSLASTAFYINSVCLPHLKEAKKCIRNIEHLPELAEMRFISGTKTIEFNSYFYEI